MKRKSNSWDTVLIASIVLIAGVCAQPQQAAHAKDADLEGPIVQISPDEDGQDLADLATEPKTRIVAEKSYWIGIRGRSVASEVLRTHLQLAEDMGVVVEEVIPDSPAAKAGLQKHDIILRADGDAVDNMAVMQKHVRKGGDKPIELKIIRYGKQEKLVIVPELRPQQFSEQDAGPRGDRWGRWGGDPQDLLDQQMLRGQERLNAQRWFGPGIILEGQRLDLSAMPKGLSVSVERRNDGPAQITVKKGDQTWNIEGDDEKALQQLPDEVRSSVERMLGGQGLGNLGGRVPLDFDVDSLLQGLPRRFGDRKGGAQDPIDQRILELERKLQDLQERVEADPAVK
ncbi:MAG: PDZ domain-containing protein [Pirellulales bacterium]|nr:PDZ domain-containing protein [Pirellulales bacterium]